MRKFSRFYVLDRMTKYKNENRIQNIYLLPVDCLSGNGWWVLRPLIATVSFWLDSTSKFAWYSEPEDVFIFNQGFWKMSNLSLALTDYKFVEQGHSDKLWLYIMYIDSVCNISWLCRSKVAICPVYRQLLLLAVWINLATLSLFRCDVRKVHLFL
jgi:hypothetical protein